LRFSLRWSRATARSRLHSSRALPVDPNPALNPKG